MLLPYIFIFLGVCIFIANWFDIFGRIPIFKSIPVLGGFMIFEGLYHFEPIRPYAFLAFFADYTVVVIIGLIYYWLKDVIKGESS